MRNVRILMFAAMLTLILVLSACGTGGGSAAPVVQDPNAPVLDIYAKNFQFDKSEYHIKAGHVKFVLHEQQGVHGMEIAALGVNLQRDGASKTINITKPGTYLIRCSVPCGSGHLNMKSKLVVE